MTGKMRHARQSNAPAVIVMIVFGITGIIATSSVWTRAAGHQSGMMNGMMDREGMKEMMQRMMPDMTPPGIKGEDLPRPESQGARLLIRYCDQCHNFPSPAMHSAEEWPSVADRMFHRMSMMSGMKGMMMRIEAPSPEEQEMIVAYLKVHALKTVSPDSLPAPVSPRAILFRDRCSQCHAIPDPKLHTADEWPRVVERMQANMRSMGKKVITESEKKEIISYLERSSQK